MFLLELAGNGKSIGVISRHLNSITFVFRWLLIDDLTSNVHVQEVFKFLKWTSLTIFKYLIFEAFEEDYSLFV